MKSRVATATSTGREQAVTERRKKMRDAVRDVPDVKTTKVSKEDVDTLRAAGLDELAEVAEIYVAT